MTSELRVLPNPPSRTTKRKPRSLHAVCCGRSHAAIDASSAATAEATGSSACGASEEPGRGRKVTALCVSSVVFSELEGKMHGTMGSSWRCRWRRLATVCMYAGLASRGTRTLLEVFGARANARERSKNFACRRRILKGQASLTAHWHNKGADWRGLAHTPKKKSRTGSNTPTVAVVTPQLRLVYLTSSMRLPRHNDACICITRRGCSITFGISVWEGALAKGNR